MNGHLKLNENLDDNLNEKLFWTGLISISHPLEKYLRFQLTIKSLVISGKTSLIFIFNGT